MTIIQNWKGPYRLYLSAGDLLPVGEIDRPIVFLADVPISDDTKGHLKSVGYEYLSEIWEDESRLRKAHDYLEEIYIDLIEKISSVLNKIHGVDYPPSFWEILLAPWLLHYIHALYDRFSRLETAISKYGKERVTLLSCKRNLKPFVSFYDLIDNTSVNPESVSAFYGVIAKRMGIHVSSFSPSGRYQGITFLQKTNYKFFTISFYEKVFCKLKDVLMGLSPINFFHGNDVLICSNRFHGYEKTIAKKLLAFFCPQNINIRIIIHQIDRSTLSSIKADDAFEKIAIKLLPKFMPQYLLEEFNSYQDWAKKWDHFKIYFSHNSWYQNIFFCYAASFGRLRGAKIVLCQHGGNYGQSEKEHSEFVERRVSDYYATWGWKDSHYSGAKILALPEPYLSYFRDKHKPKGEIAVLCGTSLTLHLIRLGKMIPKIRRGSLNSMQMFLSHLHLRIRKFLIYRPHPVDYGWLKEIKALLKKYPEVKVEHKEHLPYLLQKIKLYICDHQGTSFMEAFVTNTPSILFWNSDLIDERETAIQYFDLLRDAGILFHDPIKAAEQVNSIWDNIQGWWLHPDRQNARLEFINAFCQVENNWLVKWIDAFNKIKRN